MKSYSFKVNINEIIKLNSRKKSERRRKRLKAKYDKYSASIENKYDYYNSEELRLAKIELENQFDYHKRAGERFSSIVTLAAVLVSMISIGFTLVVYDPVTTNEIRTQDKKITFFEDQSIDHFFDDSIEKSKATSVLIQPNPDIENKQLAFTAMKGIGILSFVLGIATINNLCRDTLKKSWKFMIEIEMINNLIQRKNTIAYPKLEIDTPILSYIRCCGCNNMRVLHCRKNQDVILNLRNKRYKG